MTKNAEKLSVVALGQTVSRGAETRGGYILPNDLTVFPPIICVWSTSASPQ